MDLLGQKQFAAAVAANAKALRLDPSSVTARGNLLATINNWAVAEASARSSPAGLLRQGLAVDPTYEMFKNNDRHVHRQWIAHCRAEEFAQALDVLAAAARERPKNRPSFALARTCIGSGRAAGWRRVGRARPRPCWPRPAANWGIRPRCGRSRRRLRFPVNEAFDSWPFVT